MNLRPKLALTIIAIAIPLVIAVEFMRSSWYERSKRERRAQTVEALSELLTTRFEEGNEITRVDRESWRWGGIGALTRRGTRGGRRVRNQLVASAIWAYDIGFGSDNTQAPPFPADLRQALKKTKSTAHVWRAPSEPMSEREFNDRVWRGMYRRGLNPPPRRGPVTPGPKPRLEFAMMTSDDDGPAAVIYVTGWLNEQERDTTWWWLSYALSGAFLIVALLAAGPIVHRIRQLTDEVGGSAHEDYTLAVQQKGSDEIARLAGAFNKAGTNIRQQMDRVAASEAALRRFVANTTHDVMIPLTVLQGHLTNLRTKLRVGEDDEARGVLSAASMEAHYLGSILSNLSAVSKLEGADYEIRNDPVDLVGLVERVVQRHKTIANTRSISIDYGVPPHDAHALGDVTLLEQAVSNITHNAVRYNEAGGNVGLILDVVDDAKRFRLRVIDDGPGISEEELAKLPERRFRGDEARTRNPDGLGLGLHIARDVADKHGFEFTLRHSEYDGLEVEFAGPLARA